MTLFDVNDDGSIDSLDHHTWVVERKQTYFGDANLDGEFLPADLVEVLAAGRYEDPAGADVGWREGDFNGDGKFTSGDLTLALAGGGYELGPRASVVPEPRSWSISILASAGLLLRGRRRRARSAAPDRRKGGSPSSGRTLSQVPRALCDARRWWALRACRAAGILPS